MMYSPSPTDEFAQDASEWPNELSRRRFVQLMAASVAFAGSAGCTRQPLEHIVPYVQQPEDIIPGKPLYFATALVLGGYARGVLVETHEGRPTKIEGNPLHPASLGASDVFMQAELLTLFDPERSQAITQNGDISTWGRLLAELATAGQKWKINSGAGLRFLTRRETSPTFLDQIRRLVVKYPAAKWHEYEPLASTAPAAIYDLDKATVIVSLGADFLSTGPASLKYTRDFANGRRRNGTMSRLYVAESTLTLTGAMADHRLVLPPAQMESFAAAIATLQPPVTMSSGGRSNPNARAISNIIRDLQQHRGNSLVIGGDYESAAVHDAARKINDTLGNTGTTVHYPAEPEPRGRAFQELIQDLSSGAVETLIVIGGNPAYDAPADFEFRGLLRGVPLKIHLDLYSNETAELCHWHIPEAHSLEQWSDARAFDGTATILQPVIEPLFAGQSRHALLSALLEEAPASSYDLVRGYWQRIHSEPDFEKWWRKSVHDGVVAGPIPSAQLPSVVPTPAPATSGTSSGMYLFLRPSSQVYDGRFANNAWLQEFPEPLTTIVWDNAALIGPATARQLQLDSGEVVNLKFRGHTLKAPVWILPGQGEQSITIHLGYGRTRSGSVGTGIGFNAYALRLSDALWGGAGVEVEKTGQRHDFVTTQQHWKLEGRDQVRVGTFAQYQADPRSIIASEESPPKAEETLYGGVNSTGHAWAMVIDLNTCIGCGACIVACQAENNIPVVGKEQVARGRAMHWIRVDRYYHAEGTNARTYHQPVPCMHCENAPCELVCPVAATVHSAEGLNQMVYNRCIGTRYCSNNCPYKVRRFNFLEYDGNRFEQPITRKLMRNPNVTVRSRGVMEKCTYCVQRINAVKIAADEANRVIVDGEITPACAQACPAEAIIFGNMHDRRSRVARLRQSPLNYGLLAELNTRPRTTYLARLRNLNPEMESMAT